MSCFDENNLPRSIRADGYSPAERRGRKQRARKFSKIFLQKALRVDIDLYAHAAAGVWGGGQPFFQERL